ncbi:hypothetical protein O9Z70_12825 [Devosia sp. YIM 151766]|uniref:hypothetical protein n=1 Tax=Devosia sp. YIM 151766 TaxID=3017325 RepID=UPI00255CB858|nr:hypothetical protein [Devosia sp. YIM 151766]WIY52337.1 hypothetical protein O9Z70_12825 [Devosia sp. YIM 151766]
MKSAWSSWSGSAVRWALLGFAFAGLFGCVLFLLRDNPRSFAVEAAARGAQVRIDHPAMSQWLLDRAQLCIRRERRLPGALAEAFSICDPSLYEVAIERNVEVFWPAGAEFQLTRTGPQSPLLVRLVSEGAVPVGDRTLTRSDLLVVDSRDWMANGPLTIAGHVVVGSRPGPGEVGNLLGGTYSVSERLPLSLGPSPIMEGKLLSGDAVEILIRRNCSGRADDAAQCSDADPNVRRFGPAQSFGFIEPRGADDAGFGITLYSEASDSSLSIDRFGASGLMVTPNWVHRALGNPVLLGASALLAILSGLSSLNFLVPLLVWASKAARPGAVWPGRGRRAR